MKMLKDILLMIAMTVVMIYGFGGGCLIWSVIAIIIKPNPLIAEIMFYASALVPIPFCWWVAPKIGEKFFKGINK